MGYYLGLDRVLLNPWVSRAGNASFLIGAVLFVVRFVSGWDPLFLIAIVLLAVGVALIMAPYLAHWRKSQGMNERIRREGKAALQRRRSRAQAIEHREGCPVNPDRVETFMQTRPDGIEVETTRCVDCGAAVYRHSDALAKGADREWSPPESVGALAHHLDEINRTMEEKGFGRNPNLPIGSVFSSFEVSTPWQFRLHNDADDDERVLFVDFRFTNQQPSRRVNLEADLMWQLTLRDQPLGSPHAFSRNETFRWKDRLDQPLDISPESTVRGTLLFRSQQDPFLLLADDASQVVVQEGTNLFLRLTDHVSGEQRDVPLDVRIAPKQSTKPPAGSGTEKRNNDVNDQTKRELSKWILAGEKLKQDLRGVGDHDMDVMYRTSAAMDAETWARSVRLWIDAELPTEIGLFSSDPDIGTPSTVEAITAFVDVRTGELRRMLERL